jgi:hypothetical protein
MQVSADTVLRALPQIEERCARRAVLVVGEERLGPPDESVKVQLEAIKDLERLDRMLRRAAKAVRWQQILDTPPGEFTPVFKHGGSYKEAREFLIGAGQIKLGPPDQLSMIRLASITDAERLERMTYQTVTAASWGEVLDTP